jgi:hypothetical protein
MSNSKLPEQVQKVKCVLARNPSNPHFEVAQKLINDTPDHILMWKSLERHEIVHDNFWVWAFLEAASNACTLPPYHYMSLKDRNDLSDRIDSLSKELSRTLKVNGLDVHMVYARGTVYNGFYCFEDFTESNQERIEADNAEKLSISELLKNLSERSKSIIADEPLPGKAGKNVKAIRFIRLMAKRNFMFYKTPLNKVIATAANSIFETQYSESDIRKLLSR